MAIIRKTRDVIVLATMFTGGPASGVLCSIIDFVLFRQRRRVLDYLFVFGIWHKSETQAPLIGFSNPHSNAKTNRDK
jgi:hypothetical protein